VGIRLWSLLSTVVTQSPKHQTIWSCLLYLHCISFEWKSFLRRCLAGLWSSFHTLSYILVDCLGIIVPVIFPDLHQRFKEEAASARWACH
jgi:hypothetical protein